MEEALWFAFLHSLFGAEAPLETPSAHQHLLFPSLSLPFLFPRHSRNKQWRWSATRVRKALGIMFAPPQCRMGGDLSSDWPAKFSAVYFAPQGAMWAIDASGMRVFYFSVSHLAYEMERPSSSSASASPHVTAERLSEPVFQCSGTDRICSVVFPISHDAQHLFVCIATVEGFLALGDADYERGLLQQSDLGVSLTAIVAASPGATHLVRRNGAPKAEKEAGGSAANVLIAFFDGTFSEVVLVQWDSDHDKNNEDEAVVATGLFRIGGRVNSVVVDESGERIVTITQNGNVDIWNWRKGMDETQSFGMPAYHVEEHGIPSCVALVKGCQLWIGTATGSVVVFSLKLNAVDGAPLCAWRAHEGGVPVRTLLIMSLGRYVWSCAADCQACVWDTTTLRLHGSFQFPGTGLMDLRCGMRCIDTTVWGVSDTLGTLSWFTVREPLLLCSGSFSLVERDECSMKKSDLERLRVLEVLVSHLVSLLRDAAAVSEGTGDTDEVKRTVVSVPLHVEVALQQLEEEQEEKDSGYSTLRSLPLLVASLIAGQRMLQRTLCNEGRRSKSFLEDLQYVLQEQRRHRKLQEQVGHLLSEIRDKLPNGEVCENLEDVADIMLSLLQRNEGITTTPLQAPNVVKELDSSLLTRVGSLREVATVVTPPRGSISNGHVQNLEARLAEEEKRRRQSEVQLAEIQCEKQELQRQLKQSLRLEEDYERRNTSLERMLKTAKKAAEVTSSEATRLYEMEANLHEAHHTIQRLQEKVEGLMRERHEAAETALENKSLKALVRRFELKEQLAKQAFSNFIETQDRVFDDLGKMLHDADDDDHKNTLYTSMMTLYEWLSARSEQQHEFHITLKHRYTMQSQRDEDRRGESPHNTR